MLSSGPYLMVLRLIMLKTNYISSTRLQYKVLFQDLLVSIWLALPFKSCQSLTMLSQILHVIFKSLHEPFTYMVLILGIWHAKQPALPPKTGAAWCCWGSPRTDPLRHRFGKLYVKRLPPSRRYLPHWPGHFAHLICPSKEATKMLSPLSSLFNFVEFNIEIGWRA